MLSDEELELFELAYLLRMPVYKLLDEMPYEEYLGWQDYFRKRPPGWREDFRVSLQLKAAGVKADASKIFPSLARIGKPNSLADSLKGSTLFQKMLSTKGHKINLEDGDDNHSS